MSSRHQKIALALFAAALQPAAGWAQTTDPVRALIEQGDYWQSRGDSARAAEAWQKLLRINPQQADALYGLAQTELDAGRIDAARARLDQLRRAAPGDGRIARLEQDIAVGRSGNQLQQARQQARAGRTAEAVATYRSIFGNRDPEGPVALEYYQTLGATTDGWEEARRGLERLAQQAPNDARVALALAQHLTYREPTRREGIAQLARLATRNDDTGRAASDSWRKALAWTGSRPADAPLYQAYLQAHPGDAAIRARIDAIEQQQRASRVAANPMQAASTAAFQSLDAGDLEAAEAGFQRVLQSRPDDGDALGGLGILRLRQEKFAEARDLLERASRRGAPARWRAALNSASYWTLVEQAQAARGRGDDAAATTALEQAIRLNGDEPTAQIALGDVLAAQSRFDTAEAAYRRVLQRQADNPDALRGLVNVLAQSGKAPEALALVEQLTPQQQEKVGALGPLRASQSVAAAKAATARGDDNAARLALEDALLQDPASPWVRLDLARLYLKVGATAEARGVVDGLLVSNPNMPEALYASALLASEIGDWAAALATLERIPEASRTRDMATLQRRAWVQTQAAQASELARQGRAGEARALLAQAEGLAAQDTELLGAVASAYVDAGDANRALGMIRQLLSRSARPDVGLQLAYASILLKTRQDIELAGILRQLQSTPMSASQRRGFDDLRVAYIVRQADALREAGDLVTAYDTLAPLLAERPDDVQVASALARMYNAANQPAQALAVYKPLLQRQPQNLELLLAVAGAATAAKDYGEAESAVHAALLRAPQSPEALAAAGRLYRAQGQNTRAAEMFTASLEAENRQRARVAGMPGAPASAPARAANPFAGLPGQRARTAQTPTTGYGAGYPPSPAPTAYPAVQAYPATASAAPSLIPLPAGAARLAAAAPAYIPAAYQADTAPAMAGAPAPWAAAAPAAPAAAAPAAPARAPAAAARSRSTPAAASSRAAPRATSVAAAPASLPAFAPAPPPAPAAASAYIPLPAAPATQQPDYGGYAAAAPAAAVPGYGSAPSRSRWDDAPLRSPAQEAPRTVRDELAEIQQGRSASITVGAVGRIRQGEDGTSKLADGRVPVELSLPVDDARIVLRVTPTLLSAGTPDSAFGNLSRFGGGPDAALNQASSAPGSQNAGGVGVAVAYETDRLKLDLGTTPLGFRQTDVTGGVRLNGPIGSSDFNYAAEISRRPVTDSLLSFAGARDARTGQAWGGVSATGGRVQLGWDNSSYGAYGYAALHAISGTNVQSNSRAEVGGGFYSHFMKTSSRDLTIGLAANALTYDKNLRYFTYGQGGYFSPQQFFAAGIPIEFNQRSGKLSYQLRGSLGLQHFKEDPVNYFPTSSTLQTAAQAAMSDAAAFGLIGTGATAVYPGQTKTGLGYNFGAAMEYQVGPQMFLGGHFAADNASNYRQFVGGVYMRYTLEPYSGPAVFPVQPFRSPYGF